MSNNVVDKRIFPRLYSIEDDGMLTDHRGWPIDAEEARSVAEGVLEWLDQNGQEEIDKIIEKFRNGDLQ